MCDCFGTVINPPICPRGVMSHGAPVYRKQDGHCYVLVTDSGWWKFRHAEVECPQCVKELENLDILLNKR